METIAKSNGFMQSEYDAEHKVIYIYHEGIPMHEKVVDGWEAIMNYVKNNKVPVDMMFGNAMFVKGTFTKSNDFLKKVAIFFNDTDLKYYSTAMSADVFTRFAINQFLKFGSNKFEMRVFKNSQEVKTHLEAKMNIKLTVPELYMKS